MFELVTRARARDARSRFLVHDRETLRQVEECVRRALSDLPWQFRQGALSTRLAQAVCQLADGCPAPYVLRQLDLVVPLRDVGRRVLAALTAADGPFALTAGAQFVRGDLATAQRGETIHAATLDDDVTVDQSLYVLLDRLPRRATPDELRAALLDALVDFELPDAPERVADMALARLLELGLLRPTWDGIEHAAPPCILRGDPRATVYVAFERVDASGDGSEWIDATLDRLAGPLEREVFAPVLRLVTPAPRSAAEARDIVGTIVRLRNHLFDMASCVLLVDPLGGGADDEGFDVLAASNRGLECNFTVVCPAPPGVAAPATNNAVQRAIAAARSLGAEPVLLVDDPRDGAAAAARLAETSCALRLARHDGGGAWAGAHEAIESAPPPARAALVADALSALRCGASRRLVVRGAEVVEACPLHAGVVQRSVAAPGSGPRDAAGPAVGPALPPYAHVIERTSLWRPAYCL